MFAKGQTVIQMMERLAPKHLAVPDDRIGLQLGSLQKKLAMCLWHWMSLMKSWRKQSVLEPI